MEQMYLKNTGTTASSSKMSNICPIIKRIFGTTNVFFSYTKKRKNTSWWKIHFYNQNWVPQQQSLCSFFYLCIKKNTFFVLIVYIRVRLIIGQMLWVDKMRHEVLIWQRNFCPCFEFSASKQAFSLKMRRPFNVTVALSRHFKPLSWRICWF